MYAALCEFTAVMLFAALLEVLMQRGWIRWMRAHRIQQVTKMYGPSWHEKTKTGTPTMGGVVFIPVFLAALLLAYALDPKWLDVRAAILLFSYPFLAALVGLVDDYVKFKRHASDGITSLQKLFLQIVVTVGWAWFAVPLNMRLLPGIALSPFWSILLVTFFGVGIQNAVNVTDGLDGLAAGCALISFFGALWFAAILPVDFIALAAGCGICLSFLWHNTNPAAVFMGDVGAHFLAGLLLAVCVTSRSFLFMIPLSFMFGVEMISVTLQIFSIRIRKKRVFLMAPIHHHFEKKGWSETQIVTRFWMLHIIGLFLLSVALLSLIRGF